MLLTSGVLKTVSIPNKYPTLPNLLISTNISVLYIHLGEIPDMIYEKTADIVLGWFQAVIPKQSLTNKEMSFYQVTGSDGYVGLTEVR